MFRIPLALAFCLSLAAGAQAQDAGNGERVFAACKLCHQLGVDAKSVAGPELNGAGLPRPEPLLPVIPLEG